MDNLNPYSSPKEENLTHPVTYRRNRQLVSALVIAGIGPIVCTALSNLVVAIYDDCNTFGCRFAVAKDGAFYGAIAAGAISTLIALIPDWIRIFAALALLSIWTIAANRFYVDYYSRF